MSKAVAKQAFWYHNTESGTDKLVLKGAELDSEHLAVLGREGLFVIDADEPDEEETPDENAPDDDTPEDVMTENIPAPAPVKRGRGRPRKYPA